MSHWTYVKGVVEVNTPANTSAEAMFLAQTVVNHLPKIRGSEGDVSYHLNLRHGANFSSNADEFDNFSNLYNGTYFKCFEGQSCVLITLDGDLRDAEFPDTLRETTKALARLASKLVIMSCIVSVSSYEKSFVFNNPDWLDNAKPSLWVHKLRWDRASLLPEYEEEATRKWIRDTLN